MIRNLHFAECAIQVEAIGDLAEDLLIFLSKGLPETGKAQPQVRFTLEDVEQSGEIQLFIVDNSNPKSQNAAPPNKPQTRQLKAKGPPNMVISQLLFLIDFHLANHASQGLYLHAASLAKNGKAVLLAGNTGSGKSTLSFWLVNNGFQYMSDEATFIPSGSLECQGFTRPLHIRDDGLDLFDQMDHIAKLSISFSKEISFGHLLDASQLNPVLPGEKSKIKAIIFPSYQADSKPEFEKLTPALAAFELAQCLINARNLEKNGFSEIIRLTKIIPCWRFKYGLFDQIQELLKDIDS